MGETAYCGVSYCPLTPITALRLALTSFGVRAAGCAVKLANITHIFFGLDLQQKN